MSSLKCLKDFEFFLCNGEFRHRFCGRKLAVSNPYATAPLLHLCSFGMTPGRGTVVYWKDCGGIPQGTVSSKFCVFRNRCDIGEKGKGKSPLKSSYLEKFGAALSGFCYAQNRAC